MRRRNCYVASLTVGLCICYSFYILTFSRKDSIVVNYHQLCNSAVAPSRKTAHSKHNGEEASSVQRQIPNLPFDYWLRNKGEIKKGKDKHKCSTYPSVFDLKFNNNYWQVLHTSDGTFYLYGAYHDNRKAVERPSIRIIAMVDRVKLSVKTHCQLWYDIAKDPLVVPFKEYDYIWNRTWGYQDQSLLQPYLITCELPNEKDMKSAGYSMNQVPISVSLTEKPCDVPTNNLLINNIVPGKRGRFAVCVKGLDFPDEAIGVRLIEWIEMMQLLGAEKIFLYELNVHPAISAVLGYYEEAGRIEVLPISLPGHQSNIAELRHLYFKEKISNKRLAEVVTFNDCLYRNLNSYDYLVVLDIDEVIMPKTVTSWNQLINMLTHKTSSTNTTFVPSYYAFRNAYFWDDKVISKSEELVPDVPLYMHMMRHVYRSANYTDPRSYVKSISDVQKILTVHNHYPLACLGPTKKCHYHTVDVETAHMQHYRADCHAELKKTCKKDFKTQLIKDTTIWRYADDLISRANRTMNELGFFVSSD